jgi:ribokinase
MLQSEVIDTTAAGDAFLGLCSDLAEKTHSRSFEFANGAGALATTKLGAQPSLPSRPELLSFLKNLAPN